MKLIAQSPRRVNVSNGFVTIISYDISKPLYRRLTPETLRREETGVYRGQNVILTLTGFDCPEEELELKYPDTILQLIECAGKKSGGIKFEQILVRTPNGTITAVEKEDVFFNGQTAWAMFHAEGEELEKAIGRFDRYLGIEILKRRNLLIGKTLDAALSLL